MIALRVFAIIAVVGVCAALAAPHHAQKHESALAVAPMSCFPPGTLGTWQFPNCPDGFRYEFRSL